MSHTTENTARSTGKDLDAETYRTSFGPRTTSPSEAIITAVESLTGDPPETLPPLYDAISPDALDTLFQPGQRGTTPPDARLTFGYHAYQITVNATGLITIVSDERVK